MIYVLSGSRRETARWAKSHDIPLRSARHVYDAQSLPGRLGKQRIIELPGFASRRNRHAILNRLKLAKGLAVEKVDPDEPFSLTQMPRDDMVEVAEAMGADFVDLTADEDESDSEEYCEHCKAGLESSEHFEKCTKPARDAEEQIVPGEVLSESHEGDPSELESFLGLSEKEPEPEEDDVKAHEVVEVVQPVEAEAIEESKPKRTRRTKAQMAYDAALTDWENNGGSLEAVIEARDALAAKHPDDARLLTAPQSDAEVEAQAEDDDALDF